MLLGEPLLHSLSHFRVQEAAGQAFDVIQCQAAQGPVIILRREGQENSGSASGEGYAVTVRGWDQLGLDVPSHPLQLF